MSETLTLLDDLEGLLRGAPEAAEVISRLRARLVADRARIAEAAHYRMLLQRTAKLTAEAGIAPVAGTILDASMEVVGARRGFVGLVSGERWRFLLARNLDGPVDDPATLISTSVIEQALKTGSPVIERDAGGGHFSARRSVRRLRLRSIACFPVGRPRPRGFVYLDNHLEPGVFDPAAIEAIRAWLPIFEQALGAALSEREEGPPFPGYLTRSRALTARLHELARVADYDVPVLMFGETGTGKSYLARKLHEASSRTGGPFVHVNCAALPAELIESELFGVEAGAFTGARQSRPGRFEAAQGGTLFLDELNSTPPSFQAKLLVALQDKAVTRLGSNRARTVDVRVLAAMSEAPQAAIARGQLREDLFYRLAVMQVPIPPLRERRDDLPLLAQHALERARERFGLPPLRLSQAALAELLAHDWPGNVRELENALDRAALLSNDGQIHSLGLLALEAPTQAATVAVRPKRVRRPRVGAEEFLTAWQQTGGDIDGAAAALKVNRRTVFKLRNKYLDG